LAVLIDAAARQRRQVSPPPHRNSEANHHVQESRIGARLGLGFGIVVALPFPENGLGEQYQRGCKPRSSHAWRNLLIDPRPEEIKKQYERIEEASENRSPRISRSCTDHPQ
jgi:hypothetical protein